MLNTSGLTPATARLLDAEGRFVLPPPAPAQFATITEADARARAEAWVRDFGTMNRPFLEERHRGPIDFSTLRVCQRVYFAASPYAALPADFDVVSRNFLGPQWLVSLCDPNGKPTFSLAVAAYSVEVGVKDGHITFPRFGGNDHFWLGIPPGAEFPISPERAAEVAAQLTGRKVAGVPELVLAEALKAPQFARWRVPLDGAVHLRGVRSGAVAEVTEVFVGSELDAAVGLALPDASRGQELLHRVPVRDADLRRTGTRIVPVPVRRGQPHGFEPATVISTGR